MAWLRPIVWACIALALAACHRAAPPAESAAPSSAAPSTAASDAIAPDDAAAIRVAQMRSQILVAMRLVDEGAGTEASIHFRRPLEDADDATDLDVAKFAVAAENAALGKSARELSPMADALEKQIERLAPRRYSKPVVLKALLRALTQAYRRGVQGPTVASATDYQDAYGLALVAAELLADAARESDANAPLQREGEALVNMFPAAASPVNPASTSEVEAQISRIELAYPAAP